MNSSKNKLKVEPMNNSKNKLKPAHQVFRKHFFQVCVLVLFHYLFFQEALLQLQDHLKKIREKW